MRKKSLLTTRTKRNSIEISESTLISLSPKEKSNVISSFPSYDNEIQFFWLGKLKTQSKQYDNGICAISMHCIGLFSQKSQGKVKKINFFYIMNLTKFILTGFDNRQQLYLETETTNARLLSGPVLMAARIIYRNYSFSTFSLPQNEKMSFYVSDILMLPPIQFPLSISQIFQFRFASLLAQREINYDHNIVQYFHSLLQSHNPIFDLKNLPKIGLFSSQNSFVFDIKKFEPLFEALLYIPTIFGFSCTRCDLPQILSMISPFVEKSPYLRYLNFSNCNVKTGLSEFSKAVEKNHKNLPLEQIFIDDNEFEHNEVELTNFIHSISLLNSQLTHFSITGCGITSQTGEKLFESLLKATSLKKLQHLGIGGIEITECSAKLFSQYIKKNRSLKSIDLTGSVSFSLLLATLVGSSVRSINLSQCDFDDRSVSQLSLILPSLNELDISGSNANYYEVSDFISLLGKKKATSTSTSTQTSQKEDNANSQKLLTVKLNHLNFAKERSLLIVRGFLANDLKKWHHIEMNDTHITSDELCCFQSLFMHMPNLEVLSMGANFGENEAKFASALADINSLKVLKLADSKLGQIVSQIAATETLKEVDFSGNPNITDEDAIFLLSNTNLEIVKLENIEFKNRSSVEAAANDNTHLVKPPFKNSFISIKNTNSSRQKKRVLNFLPTFKEELRKQNVYQHSSVSEDLKLPYPFVDQFHDSQGVEIGDPIVYSTFHMNLIAIENNKKTKKVKSVLCYPQVELDEEEEDSELSNGSIDELMNKNLIPTLSETMFTGLGGTLSDSSIDGGDHHITININNDENNNNYNSNNINNPNNFNNVNISLFASVGHKPRQNISNSAAEFKRKSHHKKDDHINHSDKNEADDDDDNNNDNNNDNSDIEDDGVDNIVNKKVNSINGTIVTKEENINDENDKENIRYKAKDNYFSNRNKENNKNENEEIKNNIENIINDSIINGNKIINDHKGNEQKEIAANQSESDEEIENYMKTRKEQKPKSGERTVRQINYDLSLSPSSSPANSPDIKQRKEQSKPKIIVNNINFNREESLGDNISNPRQKKSVPVINRNDNNNNENKSNLNNSNNMLSGEIIVEEKELEDDDGEVYVVQRQISGNTTADQHCKNEEGNESGDYFCFSIKSKDGKPKNKISASKSEGSSSVSSVFQGGDKDNSNYKHNKRSSNAIGKNSVNNTNDANNVNNEKICSSGVSHRRNRSPKEIRSDEQSFEDKTTLSPRQASRRSNSNKLQVSSKTSSPNSSYNEEEERSGSNSYNDADVTNSSHHRHRNSATSKGRYRSTDDANNNTNVKHHNKKRKRNSFTANEEDDEEDDDYINGIKKSISSFDDDNELEIETNSKYKFNNNRDQGISKVRSLNNYVSQNIVNNNRNSITKNNNDYNDNNNFNNNCSNIKNYDNDNKKNNDNNSLVSSKNINCNKQQKKANYIDVETTINSPSVDNHLKPQKFFGSITEESQSSAAPSINKKRIPPPPPPLTDETAAGSSRAAELFRINTILTNASSLTTSKSSSANNTANAAASSAPKKSKEEERQNPIILALTPPTLSS